MIIDASIIQDGITPAVLDKLIQLHEAEKQRYDRLYKYYRGEHDILNRERESDDVSNIKVVCNHAKYITDMAKSYLVGNPVAYTASDEVDIQPLKDAYFRQDMAATDGEIVKNMSIYGHAYELVYRDGDADINSVVLNPSTVFVVYDNTARKRKLFAVNYYRRYDLDGNCKGIVCFVYDEKNITEYTNTTDNRLNMVCAGVQPHYFNGIPIIEYRNNGECQGDFEQIIPLIDAYNILQSDRVNDKAQFVDAFLFLRNIEIDSETAKKLKRERVLLGYEDSMAQYLAKTLSETDVKVLRDDIKEDIHRFAMVPDLSDESFGNNLSGVAIKYKLMGFEQFVKDKERLFANGLKARFALYNGFLALKSKMQLVDTADIDIVFTRNLPVNELEKAQMISYLTGTVSTETLIEQLPFVSDAKEEKELLDTEKEQDHLNRVKAVEGIARGGGYGDDFNSY